MGEIADALRRADQKAPASDSPAAPPPTPDSPQDHRKLFPRVGRRLGTANADSADSVRPRSAPASSPGPAATPAPSPKPSLTPKAATYSLVDPTLPPTSPAGRISIDEPRSLASQEYLRVAFRLRDLAMRRGARSIVLTSAEPLDGKTTTASNLAIQLARLDHSARVVLVDFDLHRATLGGSLGISVDVGLDAAIRGDATLAEAVVDTDHPGLSILGLRGPVEDADRLLSHPNVATIISDLERDFDMVVIDSPPILAVSDAQMLLRHAGAGLIVARAGKTPARLLKRALEHFSSEKLIGTLLNSSRRNAGLTEYGYYGDIPKQAESAESQDKSEEKPEVQDEQ